MLKLQWVCLVLPLLACEPEADDWPAGRPQIVDVNYLDQSSDDPNSLNFELEFSDSDGDLSGGALEVDVNSSADSRIDLADVFAAQIPALASDSTSGRFRVSLMLSGVTPMSGDTVTFEFALSDASGQTSNRASLSLLAIVRGEK